MEKRSGDKIIFYAPVGNLIKGFKNGGAEAGCRKTMAVLEKAGYDLILIEKPARKSSSKLGGFLFIFSLINIWIRLIGCFFKNRKAVFHVAGFYLNQIYFECLLIKTAKILGVKPLYEIRNGGMIEEYNSRGGIYRYFMKKTLMNSALVLCQGYDYVVFLKEKLNKGSVYYPNYIMDDFVVDNNNGREAETKLRLIYFGRVVADKNIEFILLTAKKLNDLKVDYVLDIIGGYEDAYHQKLMRIIADNNINNGSVLFHGQMNFSDIHVYLKKAHFFIFPSREKREGHSNALTEAMGSGVVPVASTAGFNSSIVNDPRLVVPVYDPLLYANVISEIYKSHKWKEFSDEVYKRVVDNFTESVVKKSLLQAYDNLYK